jgi:hypothetical protein
MAWTDTHGVAQCSECGAPYRVFHYEGDERKRVEKAPECLIRDEDLATDRRCYTESGARLSAVGFGLSFRGGYEVATREDTDKLIAWHKAEKAR